jgi:hypothetical protein
MKNLIPDVYQSDIYSINYRSLFKEGKRVLLFDLDNTMVPYNEYSVSSELVKLISELKNSGFKIHLFSNSIRGRKVKRVAQDLDIDYNLCSRKPFKGSFKKLIERNNYNIREVVMIGDQLFTDILGGNRIGITTILVDQASFDEAFVTKLMRLMEKIVKNKFKKKGQFEDKKYYDKKV